MSEYPLIADHGLIGDLHTAALVTTDGTVDWLCLPRFDSPSVFASLLDAEGGGSFRIGPKGGDYVVRQLYLPDTAILVTRFMSEDGVGELIDFMPVSRGRTATARRRLVRGVRVVRGRMRFVLDCDPRFDYGRSAHTVEVTEQGAVFHTPELELTLHAPGLEADGSGVRATFDLRQGDSVTGAVLESSARRRPGALKRESSCDSSRRPSATGRDGLRKPTIAGGGGRWSTARPSP
jgi:GH15 family glucan-1,4-alpha-glucosidase